MSKAVCDLISEDDFFEVWGAKTTETGDLFDFNEVRSHENNFVWTVVEAGDESDRNWYAMPGYHVVNKMGYVVTEKPWAVDTPDAIYFLDDFENHD